MFGNSVSNKIHCNQTFQESQYDLGASHISLTTNHQLYKIFDKKS